MSISGLGSQDALRGYGQVGRTPLLGQVDSAASTKAVGGASPASDRSTLSAELGESEGGANQLLAAWGAAQPAATAPPLAITGANPGANAGFSISGGGVGGLEPGMQANSVMMGPVLRA
ncbi:hypothetical protein ABS71_11415 [bacterium SCN 62-11]|nr:hypothetical protein [Candidatus Eremiobacteraeota bacterium]ODT67131.1 MAG: hypothetical protein ABS71_11415 [bacterium SCN 62-11]